MNAIPDIRAEQAFQLPATDWIAEIARENEGHPRINEIKAYCAMAFHGSNLVSIDRANEIAAKALEFFPRP
ncbi:MAG TPA: hypothetical protein VJI33_02405 [Candidatus Paceibacterota bacterium]